MRHLRPGATARRFGLFLAIAVVSALAGLILYRESFPFVEQVDLRLKDARFKLRGIERPTAPVKVVAVDNRSIKELGRWPWSRELTARLINEISRQGARVIALDMVFSEPQGEVQDRALASAVSSAGNVVLGYFFRDEPQPDNVQVLEQLAHARVTLLNVAAGVGAIPIPANEQVDANIVPIGKGAAGFGYFNQLGDRDGLYRSLPLLMLFRGDVYPSLALAALNLYRGEQLQVSIEPFGVSAIKSGALGIPAGEQGKLSLAYYGPAGTIPTVSAADVIAGRLPAGALAGQLVFVGVTETGVADLRATPLDPVLPGVEIHATCAANALEGKFLARDSRTLGIEMGAIGLLPLLLALMLAAVPSTLWGLGGFSLLAAGYLGTNFYLFSSQRLDLSIAYPLMPLALAYLGGEAYRNLVVERKGRYLKRAFSSYVSPDLVRQIEKDPDKLVLGGEQRELSILFSDIRGFTTFSESLTPPELVTLLNEYLSPMTRIVLDEQGTLDKFIGDAVMALFNAPLDVPDHATRACAAAVRMLEELTALNAGFAGRGMHTIDIGIGINTGLAVVGNMGADIRFDYTAIGDSVNLASRLEGLNKYYGSHILVSEDTRKQVSDSRFTFREVDRVAVKGKQQPIVMYALMTANHEILPRFEEALASYRTRNFQHAHAMFNQLAADFNDGPSRLYVARCDEYLAAPPSPEWDGVYVAKDK
jgi:adenylate cyclase